MALIKPPLKRFNLILREEREEVLGVIEEIWSTKAKRMGKVQDVEYFFEGARKAKIDFEKIAVKFEGLNVTSPVNNAGAFMIRPGRAGVLVPTSPSQFTLLAVPRADFHPSARLLVLI